MKLAPRSLKSRALQLLAQREHSRTELRRKLLAFAANRPTLGPGPTPDRAREPATDAAHSEPVVDPGAAVDALLDWLEAQRFLSMDRFVESRLNARSGRFGNQRIRQELAQHDASLSPQAQQLLRETEFDRALSVWERKFAATVAAGKPDAASWARQSRFLAGRGFTSEVIVRVLRETAQRSGYYRLAAPDED